MTNFDLQHWSYFLMDCFKFWFVLNFIVVLLFHKVLRNGRFLGVFFIKQYPYFILHQYKANIVALHISPRVKFCFRQINGHGEIKEIVKGVTI